MQGVPAMRHSSSTVTALTDQIETRVPDGDVRFAEGVDLRAVPEQDWAELCQRVAEPNAFYDPVWCRAIAGRARDSDNVETLLAWDANRNLIGLLPVRPARPLNLPLPLLVAWTAYAPLTIPLLDKDAGEHAAGMLLDAAAAKNSCALLMPHMAVDGPAFSGH